MALIPKNFKDNSISGTYVSICNSCHFTDITCANTNAGMQDTNKSCIQTQ